jgi:heat shock protein HtpX
MKTFATEARRDASRVGGQRRLVVPHRSRTQVGAVLGHEITHVANGDRGTLARLQGVLNTFVMFLGRIIGTAWWIEMQAFGMNTGSTPRLHALIREPPAAR